MPLTSARLGQPGRGKLVGRSALEASRRLRGPPASIRTAIYDQSKSGAAGQVFGQPVGAQLFAVACSPQRKAGPVTVPSYISDIIKDASKMYSIPELDISNSLHRKPIQRQGHQRSRQRKASCSRCRKSPGRMVSSDVYDPRQDILGGTRLLRENLDRADGDIAVGLDMVSWRTRSEELGPSDSRMSGFGNERSSRADGRGSAQQEAAAITVASETFAPEGGDMDIRPYDGGRLETPGQGRRKMSAAKPVDMTTGLCDRKFASSTVWPGRSDGEILRCLRRQEADRAGSGFRKFPNQVRGETSRASRPSRLPEPLRR
ncbi:lytic tail protein [Pseudomonas phage WP1]